jgi:hypothetical protein
MLFVLLCQLAFGAPPLPPVVSPPSGAGVAPSPYATPESWLSGKAGALNLEALSTVIRTFEIGADATGLSAVTAENADAVLRQLAADPRFRVTTQDGAIVAARRMKDGNDWAVGFEGFHLAKRGAWRALVRMTPYTNSPWDVSQLVSRADASAGAIRCIAFRPTSHPTWDTVALQWKGPVATLEVLDSGDDSLPGVQEALGYIPNYLAGVARQRADIDVKGYTPLYNVSREPRRGEPTIAITSPAAGQLEVRARIHVFRKGITWVRILDEKLTPWEPDAVAAGTREIVGWSPEQAELFYLQGRFPVPSGPKFSGTAELWFQAEGRAAERLGAFNLNIPRR